MIKNWIKVAYGSGDLAFNLGLQTTALFLMFFYTDVLKIPPAWAGVVMLIAKLWDAVTDPMLGFLVDKTKSPWGNKRPYLLFGAVPFGISIFLLFWVPGFLQGGAEGLRTGWALFGFLFFCTALTVVNIPYGALSASLTLDSKERTSLVSFRMIFGLVGTLLSALLTKDLVKLFGGGEAGWMGVGILYGTVATLLVLLVFFSVREVATEPAAVSFREGFSAALKSQPFLILAGATILIMTGVNILAGSVVYFYKYSLGQPDGETLALGLLLVLAAVSVPLFGWISGKTSKRNGFLIGLGLMILALAGLGLFSYPGSPWILGLFAIAGVGMATIYLSPWAMIPDTVEHSQWVTGVRREGALFGFFFFCFKVGAALALFLLGMVLTIGGFVADAPPTPQVLNSIRILISLLPMGFLAAGGALLLFYPLDKQAHDKILQDLRTRGEI